MDKYLRAMSRANNGRNTWTRSFGPMATLSWLKDGKLAEQVPDWFIDFFMNTRDLTAIDGDSDAFGMSSLEENWALYRLVGESAATATLEIGVMRGATTMTISRSIEDHGFVCHQTSLDIDPHAVEVVSERLRGAAKAHEFSVLAEDSREWLPRQQGGWQFTFVDGDHAYRSVAYDLVETFNRIPVGAWIVMHDTGSALWGWRQDPGQLMFGALDKELGGLAEMTWLDNSDRAQDCQLLFRLGLAPKVTSMSNSMFDGWGGLGMVRKVDDSRKLTHEQFAPYAPPVVQYQPPSLLRRVARKVKRLTIG